MFGKALNTPLGGMNKYLTTEKRTFFLHEMSY